MQRGRNKLSVRVPMLIEAVAEGPVAVLILGVVLFLIVLAKLAQLW